MVHDRTGEITRAGDAIRTTSDLSCFPPFRSPRGGPPAQPGALMIVVTAEEFPPDSPIHRLPQLGLSLRQLGHRLRQQRRRPDVLVLYG